MIDLKAFEKDPESFEKCLLRRGQVPGLSELLNLVKERKALIASSQKLQEERNASSKNFDPSRRDELKLLGQRIKQLEASLREIEEQIECLALHIPNPLQDEVPEGQDAHDNQVVQTVGVPPHFDFPVLDHVEIGQRLGVIDFERAARISGSRFAFLKGAASRLNRALIQYLCDFHVARGDTELTPPYLVRETAMRGTGQFPKFREDSFEVPIPDSEALHLIPTAEVPVTNFHAHEILEESQLPLRYCAYSACFRSEAGAASRDTRGLIRLHQFEKVEMVRFCKPEQGEEELDAMVTRVSVILSALELPHRIVLLCSGDTGFSAQKTYDIEVWLPAQSTYREISSCSVFGAFQARRAQIRYRNAERHIQSVWTLNGSGLPLGRTLVAILENHQQKDGSVLIPEVLRSYMGGQTCLI
ncbi:MAG: serine--tRNA ligase [Myxococcaceae bacterium]|nr:serine--tRNA ligase [Myxococcaceae bacterium]MBH2006098.1 serine--tRNA ligase [Myxococcaceae bacterium]